MIQRLWFTLLLLVVACIISAMWKSREHFQTFADYMGSVCSNQRRLLPQVPADYNTNQKEIPDSITNLYTNMVKSEITTDVIF